MKSEYIYKDKFALMVIDSDMERAGLSLLGIQIVLFRLSCLKSIA